MPKAPKKPVKPATDDTAIYSLNSDLLTQDADNNAVSREEAIELIKKKIRQLSH